MLNKRQIEQQKRNEQFQREVNMAKPYKQSKESVKSARKEQSRLKALSKKMGKPLPSIIKHLGE